MKEDNAIQKKSFAFAVRITRLSRYLAAEKGEQIMSRQLLRCGTSIGANIEEAIGANSRKDFEHKIRIAY